MALFLLVTSRNRISTVDGLTTSYRILLEQSDPHAVNQENKTFLYFVCAPWILTGLVITNLIRGDNVTNTVSPLKVVPYENFSQLFENNFTFVDGGAPATCQDFHRYCGSINAQAHSVAVTFALTNMGMLIRLSAYKRISKLVRKFYYETRPNKLDYWNSPKEFSCLGHKVAILGWQGKLQEAKDFLERVHPGPAYALGKESIATIKFGWATRNIVDPSFVMRFKALDSSNIAEKWVWYATRTIKLRQRDKNERITTGPAPLVMKGNITELFKVLFMGLLITFALFLTEHISSNLVVKTEWRKVQKFLIVCYLELPSLLRYLPYKIL